MKKLSLLAAVLLTATTHSQAEEALETVDQIVIPEQYLEVDKNCINTNISQYNTCLKNALVKVMKEELTDEQFSELKEQLDTIEKELNTAEPDYDNPQMKAIEGNEEKLKEFREESMNLIWKNILVETFNSLNAAKTAQ